LVRLELGHEAVLDRFVPRGQGHARAIAPARILHILSANTPAAALQTLIRGLLLGSWNRCKLPSSGLPEVLEFLARLPNDWRSAVEVSVELPDPWLAEADAVIVFGADETIDYFRAQMAPHQVFVPHGHKLSFGLVLDDPALESAAGAARDVSVFDQQGCLSPIVFFVRESAGLTAEAYAGRLADAMAAFAGITPPAPLTISEANAIQSLRERRARPGLCQREHGLDRDRQPGAGLPHLAAKPRGFRQTTADRHHGGRRASAASPEHDRHLALDGRERQLRRESRRSPHLPDRRDATASAHLAS
jgi:hypothetical protein